MTSAAPVALVLDTSVFTNPDATRQWGGGANAAFAGLLPLAEQLRGRVTLYMPLSIYEELKTFLSGEVPPAFEVAVHLQSPERYHQTVPATVLYHLIDDIRSRIDKGLRVAEKAVRTAGAADPSSDVGGTINHLRDQYRSALRLGLLDSKEDVDLLLLAREVNGALVSSDRGVVDQAERLGVRLVDPCKLRGLLESLAADQS